MRNRRESVSLCLGVSFEETRLGEIAWLAAMKGLDMIAMCV
jgi:hypothetical protein